MSNQKDGFNIVLGSVYQAIGNGVYSLIISLVRQIVVILPVAYFLGKLFGVTAIWYAFPIAEIIAAALNAYLFDIRRHRNSRHSCEFSADTQNRTFCMTHQATNAVYHRNGCPTIREPAA